MAHSFKTNPNFFADEIPLIERFGDMDFMRDEFLLEADVLEESEYHPDDEERVIDMTRYMRQPVDRAMNY